MSQPTSSIVSESSFRGDHSKILMAGISVGVINVVRELIEADIIFFRLAVALPEPMRTRVIGNRARMTQDILSLMRFTLEPATEPQRFVVHLPGQAADWSDPVRVTPSANQLTTALEHDVNTHDENCAVCQDTVASGTRLRQCGHVFHRACIMNWFEMSSRCPVCRHDVREPRADNPLQPAPSAAGYRSPLG
jgi:predicted Zn-ribbon and HTH transcriptional regulator